MHGHNQWPAVLLQSAAERNNAEAQGLVSPYVTRVTLGGLGGLDHPLSNISDPVLGIFAGLPRIFE